MKHLKSILLAACLALPLAPVLSIAAVGEDTGIFVDDSVITTRVKASLLAEPNLKSQEIKVETYKGVVQLSGFVSTPAAQAKAVEIASAVSGVKSVKNDMRLK